MKRLVMVPLLLLTLAMPGHASASETAVRGGYLEDVPCSSAPVIDPGADPAAFPFDCVGSTTWDGSWTGQTVFTAKGVVNLFTGDASGTIDETFYGVVSASQAPGTVSFHETFFLDGATNTIHIEATIIGGTDAFEGSCGTVTFDGTQLSSTVGHGGYSGTWMRGDACSAPTDLGPASPGSPAVARGAPGASSSCPERRLTSDTDRHAVPRAVRSLEPFKMTGRARPGPAS